jgi:hypothetical protein
MRVLKGTEPAFLRSRLLLREWVSNTTKSGSLRLKFCHENMPEVQAIKNGKLEVREDRGLS